jgi:hypothetical protein
MGHWWDTSTGAWLRSHLLHLLQSAVPHVRRLMCLFEWPRDAERSSGYFHFYVATTPSFANRGEEMRPPLPNDRSLFMATIESRTTPDRKASFRAKVRLRGFPPQTATVSFPTS